MEVNWQQADVLGVGEVGGGFDLFPPLRARWGTGHFLFHFLLRPDTPYIRASER